MWSKEYLQEVYTGKKHVPSGHVKTQLRPNQLSKTVGF